MKRYIVYIAFFTFVCALPVQAQVRLGIRGGFNVNKVTWKWKQLENNVRSDKRNGFFVGATLDVSLPVPGMGVDFSVLYDNRVVSLPLSEELQNQTMQYIIVPVTLRYSVGLGRILSIYAATGPQVSYNIGDRSWALNDYVVDNWTNGWELNRSDLSWNVGGGISFFGHFRLGYNYNIMLGHTNEFTVKKLSGDIVEGQLKDNTHQISLTYFF